MNQVDKKVEQKEAKKMELEKAKQAKQEKKNIYDPYHMPAKLKYAEMHEKATRFARPDKMDPKMFLQNMCPCCMMPTRNTPLTCCGDNLAAVGKVSRTLKQYFQYLLFLIAIFVLVFGLGSLPHMIFNPPITRCILANCQLVETEIISYLDDIQEEAGIKYEHFNIMSFVLVLVIFVAKYVFFGILFRQYKNYDQRKKTPGDYAVHAHNFHEFEKKSELVYQVCDILKDEDIFVKNEHQKIRLSENYISEMSRIYNIHNLTELTTNYMEQIKRKKILNRKGQYSSDKMTKIEDRIRELKAEITKIDSVEKKANFTGEAFVTFTSLKIPGQIVNNEWKVIWKKYFSKKPYFLKAAEPYDVIWSNFGISPWNRLGRIFISYLLAFILIGFSFAAILGMKVFQARTIPEAEPTDIIEKTKVYGILLMIIVIIMAINFVLRKILILVSIKEERKFYSELESSKIFKVALALFVNTGVIILVTSQITEDTADEKLLLFSSKGVVINVQLLMLISLSTPILWSLLNPFHFIRFVKRKLMESKLKDPKNQVLQLEANAAFQRNDFELDFKFYSVFKTVCIALFYQPVVPYGPLLAIFEILLWYLCDKYVLINRCSKPQELDFSFTLEMLSYFDIFLILLPLGNLIFINSILNKDIKPFLIASLVLVLMEAFVIRINVLFKCCKCCSNFEEKDEEYNSVKYRFKSYRQVNPLTSVLYKYDRKKRQIISKHKIKTGKDDKKDGPQDDDEDAGKIDLLNIIQLIGTQQGRAFGGNDRVFVEDEAFVFNDLQLQGNANRNQNYMDNPIGGNNLAGYEALMMNHNANAFMNYQQNYFDNMGDTYVAQNTYNQQNYGAQRQPPAQTYYFDTVFGQMAGQTAFNYPGAYQQNLGQNTVQMGSDQVYNPSPVGFQGNPAQQKDQNFYENQQVPNRTSDHYGPALPNQPQLNPAQNTNYNHYGNNETAGLNNYANPGYGQYGNYQNPNAHAHQNQNHYENQNPGNYFDNPNYGGSNQNYNRNSNPYGYGGYPGKGYNQ